MDFVFWTSLIIASILLVQNTFFSYILSELVLSNYLKQINLDPCFGYVHHTYLIFIVVALSIAYDVSHSLTHTHTIYTPSLTNLFQISKVA